MFDYNQEEIIKKKKNQIELERKIEFGCKNRGTSAWDCEHDELKLKLKGCFFISEANLLSCDLSSIMLPRQGTITDQFQFAVSLIFSLKY